MNDSEVLALFVRSIDILQQEVDTFFAIDQDRRPAATVLIRQVQRLIQECLSCDLINASTLENLHNVKQHLQNFNEQAICYCATVVSGSQGRPPYAINEEQLEFLRGICILPV
jgi:hypothetical protein